MAGWLVVGWLVGDVVELAATSVLFRNMLGSFSGCVAERMFSPLQAQSWLYTQCLPAASFVRGHSVQSTSPFSCATVEFGFGRMPEATNSD